jgi:hypothetical protein
MTFFAVLFASLLADGYVWWVQLIIISVIMIARYVYLPSIGMMLLGWEGLFIRWTDRAHGRTKSQLT